ncbi:MAG: 16S rRNA (uracil(1498)-N(3))-methyltransferase [Acidobacteriaceae bacterium]|nr:16S rRNA (uracil(1498)-N(3))-methyltransferase [Acidobacteriaceae bacterium]
MSRRRFFVPEVRRGLAELAGADAEHLVRVLRAEVGQLYEISDNRDVYLAKVNTARKSLVVFQVTEKLPEPPAAVRKTLCAALVKFERFEWLIEKATELGVAAIQPFECARSERGLALAAVKRIARWEKIAVEASQQSRRARLPVIGPPCEFADAVRTDATVRLLLDEDPAAPPLLKAIPEQRSSADRIALLLGPEGGWRDEEREEALTVGWTACSLGQTILRAETAGIAALAIVTAAWST